MTDWVSPTYACGNDYCDEAGYLITSSAPDPLCNHCGGVMEECNVELMLAEGMDVTVREQ